MTTISRLVLAASLCAISASLQGAVVSGIEDVTIPPSGSLNSASNPASAGFTSNGALYRWGGSSFGGEFFPHGFAASNISDTTDYGNNRFQHQYNSITGGGAAGSPNYAVANAFSPVAIDLPADPLSIAVTNNTYAYYSMKTGDDFAKKFGGSSGNDADWFLLSITGKDGQGNPVGRVESYLADFRFLENSQDFILDQWRTLDLSTLRGARQLEFALSSSDTGQFGMNTPAYFAVDHLTFVPEPKGSVLAGLAVVLLGAVWWAHARLREARRLKNGS
ncbi:MAG: DUF4465 domain-containing protein [Pirellulales bacterium]